MLRWTVGRLLSRRVTSSLPALLGTLVALLLVVGASVSSFASESGERGRSHTSGYGYCKSAGYQFIGPYGGGYDELCGSPVFTGRISGVLRKGSGTPLQGAVSVCNASACSTAVTGPNGSFAFETLPPGGWTITALPNDPSYLSGFAHVLLAPNEQRVADVTLAAPQLPPPGFDAGSGRRAGGVPVVFNSDRVQIRGTGCPSGSASYKIERHGMVAARGSLFETATGSGAYRGSASSDRRAHGAARLTITIGCGGALKVTSFDMYYRPAGWVTTLSGARIADAEVTLVALPSGTALPSHPSPVAGGSSMLSPANRANPDVTDGDGRFGWDPIAGNYRVRASKPGCHAPGRPGVLTVETSLWRTPPPRAVVLRLECPPAPAPSPSVLPSPLALTPAPPLSSPAAARPCKGLAGAKRQRCQISERLKARLARCRKLKGSKRRVCARHARSVAVCEAQKGKKRRACLRRASRILRQR